MKPDRETQQIPKWSRRDAFAKCMTSEVKPKKPMKASSDTGACKQTVAKGPTSTRGRASSDMKRVPLNIPMGDMSPEFKRLVVDELIHTGRARVVTRKGREAMAKEQKKEEKK